MSHEHRHGQEHHHEHPHDHEHDHGCCGSESKQTNCCESSDSCSYEELFILPDDGTTDPSANDDLLPGEARSVFRVDGMDCGECARTVERVVGKLAGVREVQVRFSTSKMVVIHSIDLAPLTKTVDQVGYRATLLETTLENEGEVQAENGDGTVSTWQRNRRTILTVISGLLLGVGFVADWTGSSPTLALAFYLLAMLTGGYYAARAGFYALKSWTLDMNFLMTFAAVGAAAIGQWAEGATVVFLFAVGNWLQAMTMERTRRSIRSLMDLTPKEALVRRNGQEMTMQLSQVRVGDIVIVRPGERVPMDGVVTEGSTAVNQAPVTGESMPVQKQRGDELYAGSLNETGAIEFRVTKRVEDSTIARIIHLVEEAQAQKAPSQQFVDKFATYYTPAVVVLAVLIAALPPLVVGGTYGEWVYRALALLVIACPCALVISTPVSIVSAIGNAARQGVLVKGGAFLERMGSIRAIAFDKTGTLTEGKPHVVLVESCHDTLEQEVLAIAAAIESRSEHPLARAIVAAYKQTGQELRRAEQFRAVVGHGAEAVVEGISYRIGKPAWFEDFGYTNIEKYGLIIRIQQEQGRTVMLLADETRIIGLIAVADVLRKESAETIRRLKQSGMVCTMMLTGDHERTAGAIAKEVGIDAYQGELLPEQKLAMIQELKNKYQRVAMVGDGINDAPALALADIGVAMGGAGTDAALETADLVLMSDDLSRLPFAVRLSQQTLRIIKQNIWFSLGVKAAFLVLTIIGLSNLWMAVFADTGAALIVIANGMRLMKTK